MSDNPALTEEQDIVCYVDECAPFTLDDFYQVVKHVEVMKFNAFKGKLMSDNPRDTKFAGFAEKVVEELCDVHDGCFQSGSDWWKEKVQLLVARRAYDLVVHTVGYTWEYLHECGRDIPISFATRISPSIPDLTAWPESEAK